MVDTLEITKKLEGAGFERGQAEAVAAVVAGSDKQLEGVESRLGAVETRLTGVEHGLKSLEHKVESQIAKARFEVVVWTVGALGVLAALLRLFP